MNRQSGFWCMILFAFVAGSAATCKEASADVSGQLTPVAELPKPLSECSGMVRLDHKTFVAHNDSGNKSILYIFNPKDPQSVRDVYVANAPNKDWEDITSDEDFLYISDTGNNSGKRTSLRIFKVRRSELLLQDTVTAELIQFAYEDQDQYGQTKFHNFDCEAIISKGDSLYLFTKNRGDFRTNVYVLPKLPGTHIASMTGSFDTKGLVTGADFREGKSGNELALVGYSIHGKAYYPFVIYFSDIHGAQFFTGQYQRWDYRQVLQTESIVFSAPDAVYISNEEEDSQDGIIYKIQLPLKTK